MKTWLFNPENDLALADGGARYTPPGGAMAVARSGRLLPMLWASEDDEILIPLSEDYNAACRHADVLRERYGALGNVVTHVESDMSPSPWGWSRYSRRMYQEAGVENGRLPSDAYLERIRSLSHRRISFAVNESLRQSLVDCEMPPCPAEVRSYDDVFDLVKLFESNGYDGVVVKLPWSCSSRGVVMASSDRMKSLKVQIDGMIRRQGSVMAEAMLRRKSDFAMLFESDGRGSVAFRALSMFVTDSSGRYGGNLVMPQEDIATRIGSLPHGLSLSLESALSRIIGSDYAGWVGVDMMKYDYHGHEGIAPCVEVNLRMTMGVSACLMSDRVLRHTGVKGMLLGVTPSGILLDTVVDSCGFQKDFRRV